MRLAYESQDILAVEPHSTAAAISRDVCVLNGCDYYLSLDARVHLTNEKV